jgi:hypothetical protein
LLCQLRMFPNEGAWGPSAANAFEEVLAVKAATTNRELTDFSIIKFAKHWREAVGVAILRGAAAVVAQAAPMGADEEAAMERLLVALCGVVPPNRGCVWAPGSYIHVESVANCTVWAVMRTKLAFCKSNGTQWSTQLIVQPMHRWCTPGQRLKPDLALCMRD